jgi:hypothetical protein
MRLKLLKYLNGKKVYGVLALPHLLQCPIRAQDREYNDSAVETKEFRWLNLSELAGG